jgi:hypothetical protein
VFIITTAYYHEELSLMQKLKLTLKTILMALTACLSLSILPAQAASPAAEARFLAAAKAAFQKHDAAALTALVCWDRVPENLQVSGKERLAREVALTATDLVLIAPDPQLPDLEWKDATGTAFRANLPVTRHLKITFAPGSVVQLKRGPVKVKDTSYPVGEKDGKLFLLEPAPVK